MRYWKDCAAVLLIAASAVYVAHGAVWDVTPGFEGTPAATDPVSQGDDEIRNTRVETRKRLDVEHHYGAATDADDNGTHRLGSARCFVQNAAPTVIEVADYNNSGGAGTATLSDNATNSAPAELLGLGRCWIDLDGADGVVGTADDRTLNTYTATGWQVASAATTSATAGAAAVNPGAHNLLYNGGFTADLAAATTVPAGWVAVNTPTMAYATTAVSEGVGLAFRTTAAGGTDEGASQTLSGLKANTTYYAVARVNATAGDTCSLRTTGGTANVSATSATSGAFETLAGTFTTDNTPTAVVVIIESNADTDVCLWDHVGVYEQSAAAVPQTGIVRVRATRAVAAGGLNCAATYGGAGCRAVDSGLEVFVVPPGPGYMAQITARVELELQNNTDQCWAQLAEAAAGRLDEAIFIASGSVGNLLTATQVLSATMLQLAPATTYNFEVDVRGALAGDCDLEDDVINWIEVLLIPTR